MNHIKKILPRISSQELTALRIGDLSIDRDIFRGHVDPSTFPKPKKLTPYEENIINHKTTLLCNQFRNTIQYPKDNARNVMHYAGRNGFLGMIIDQKYGGTNLSFEAQSRILTKISGHSPALGVMIMVPNSLGPGKLIQKYGSDVQKKKYLHRLADGEVVPCFALTGPLNGSDATGQIDRGRINKETNMIEITLNKRYITLAPIADLIGIAFYLEDHGVTLALVEKNHPGLLQNTHHNPNDAGFPNGTIKGSIKIPMDCIIGGMGNGWQMLMECLGVGRAISLPSSSNGMAKTLTFGIYHYIQHRKQFKIPIGNMEGIQEKFMQMFLNTWIIQASIKFTNAILDDGKQPSVISAIMKQQSTERARIILNHAMDIYAGSGICIGENNFCTKFYRNVPIGITVEGSNTLTRSLIIFGQGLNKSHPHISDIFDAIINNDTIKFQKHFINMLSDILSLYLKMLTPTFHHNPISRLNQLVIHFALLSNFMALLGGKIKSEQMLSGAMADILSNIYLSYGVIYYQHHFTKHLPIDIHDACLDLLYHDSISKYNQVIRNYPYVIPMPFINPPVPIFNKKLYHLIPQYIDTIQQDVYMDDVLTRLSKPPSLELYNDIINVTEYPNL